MADQVDESDVATKEADRPPPKTPTQPKGLKSTKSFHKIHHLNKGLLHKVRSNANMTVGGTFDLRSSDGSLFKDNGLKYDSEDEERIVGKGNTEQRIKQLVSARNARMASLQKTLKTKKAVALPVGIADPSLKRKLALKKMKLPNIPKNNKTRQFLTKCLKDNLSFAFLTQHQIDLIIQALKPKRVAANVALMNQGDVGNSFFIVQKGSLRATERKKNESTETYVCDFKHGDSFGELALLYGSRREMTVTTQVTCNIWKLDNMSFRKVMAHGEEVDFELIQQQLCLMPILSETGVTKNESQMQFLAQNVHHVKVKEGDVISAKGDVGDMLYFIIKGRVRCSKAGNFQSNSKQSKSPRNPKKVSSRTVEFSTGDYFGEGALLRKFALEKDCEEIVGVKAKRKFWKMKTGQWVRSANVFAAKDSEFFVLDYDAFKRLVQDYTQTPLAFLNNERVKSLDAANQTNQEGATFLETLKHNLGIRILKGSGFIHKMKRIYREFLLQNLAILDYEDEDLIIQAGETEKVLFLVAEGVVEIRYPNESTPGVLSPGHSFGESFFFNTKPYNFDVVAKGSTRIYAMTKHLMTQVFGPSLTLKELTKTGNPVLDETVNIDFTRFSVGNMVDPNLDAMDPLLKLKSLKSLDVDPDSTNDPKKSEVGHGSAFDLNRVSAQRTTSVRIPKAEDADVLSTHLEYKMEQVRTEHIRSLKMKKKSEHKTLANTNDASKALDSSILEKNFKIVGPIGMGTFGLVKYIRSKDNKGKKAKRYALKVLEVSKIIKLGQTAAVLNEKQILSELDHPFVLKYFASYKDTQNLYIQTELLVGGELFELIQSFRKKDGYMPDEDAIFYTACVVDIFSYLHQRHILFRDLKPENIMIDSKGYTRLVDFGFAKKVKFKTATRCGTAEYFAPEMLMHRSYNKSVDIWGIGILTYEMMTGMSPFYDERVEDMTKYILNDDPSFAGDFPDAAVDFIAGLLEKEPNERLGMSINHPEEIKEHHFLDSINWNALRRKELPAPFVPNKKIKVRSEEDLRLRLEGSPEGLSYEMELTDISYQGWYQEF